MANGPISTHYPSERNIYGRHGKLFIARYVVNAAGDQEPDQLIHASNVTEVSGTLTIDRMEVRRSGDRFVRYKAGEITGEGTMTLDKVNSDFEQIFVEYANRSTKDGFELPSYELHLSLEDPGMPGIDYDDDGFAKSGHEEIILKCVNFWSLPVGFSLADMVTRDMDFTFQGVDFGGDSANPHIVVDPVQLPRRVC